MTSPTLPPPPTIADLAASPHPALKHLAVQLADRPASMVAFYDDSPYVPADHNEETP